ncbi:glycosyltransferase family 2 protein [Planctomycetes bacterium Pla163]|uniref:glycosyltransferase family 2 protein n=1 Tax=Rohdeia mirabilis TaxID=2528008 RepID=UPI0011AB0162
MSLIAPVYDEEGNLERLYEEVRRTFADGDFELILVDDGSRDSSREIVRDLCRRDERVRGLFFRENCGQSAAITAGFHAARGDLVATMDADLQNDPRDLPDMIALLEARGVDAVVGYRQKRNDTFVRRISSKIANRIRNAISKDSIRDTGCSLKVFKREAICRIAMFDGMHRFLPTLLRYYGFDVLEHPVNHRPRTAGVSKYGISNRALRALLDLFAVRWMRSRILRPVIAEQIGRGLPVNAPARGERGAN